ncbi:hypothetical protein ACFC09_18530 [Streptomyces sp. NPDC056161]|uniref:hypothetical protein n=1 Tax=Streptomyces sp. NPDC056161 TaxID=3345732 RepID=UPI0035DC464B
MPAPGAPQHRYRRRPGRPGHPLPRRVVTGGRPLTETGPHGVDRLLTVRFEDAHAHGGPRHPFAPLRTT